MIKYVGFGLLLTLIGIIVGFFTGDWNLTLQVIGGAALLPLLVSGLLTGAFVSGDRNRANYHTEAKEDRHKKAGWIKRLLLISSPNVIFLILLIIIGVMQ